MSKPKRPRSRSAQVRTNTIRRLYRYLLKGDLLAKDENTGAVGVTWARPSRSGEHYANDIVSRLITAGCVIDGQEYRLVKSEPDRGVHTYHLTEVEA